jgi:hypothetical protein
MNTFFRYIFAALLLLAIPERSAAAHMVAASLTYVDDAIAGEGPGKRRICAAYGRKHLRRGKCGRRNRRVERFIRGYSW